MDSAPVLKTAAPLEHPDFFDCLFNNPYTATAIFDANFNFIAVNELYARQNGCTPEYFPGKNHFELYPSEEAELIFRSVVSSGQSYRASARPFQNPHTSEHQLTYWDWILTPLGSKQGRPDYLILQLVDVTQHIRELHHLEDCFYKIFNMSPILMTIRNLKTGRFILVNDTWINNVGYDRQEAIGKTPQELGLNLEMDPWNEICREGNNLTDVSICYATKNGQLREALYSSVLIELNNTTCLLSALVDITQRRAMEKEISRLDRLHLIGQMAAGIGHEIRNPLTTIRGFLQILSNKPPYAEDRSYFELMISEVDRANSIITEFLSLSKTRSENLSFNSLNTIIKAIFPLLHAQALQMDKQVKYLPGEIGEAFVCEKEIRQLILNMVTNALDASPPGGTVTVQTKQDDENILLIIKDSGPGIDPQIIQHLGTPFLTTKIHGTGLGLAICYSIMERHGGNIQVETGPGGTTFTIRFPACLAKKMGA